MLLWKRSSWNESRISRIEIVFYRVMQPGQPFDFIVKWLIEMNVNTFDSRYFQNVTKSIKIMTAVRLSSNVERSIRFNWNRSRVDTWTNYWPWMGSLWWWHWCVEAMKLDRSFARVWLSFWWFSFQDNNADELDRGKRKLIDPASSFAAKNAILGYVFGVSTLR